MGTTTNGSLMINDLNVGMEYNVSVTATNTVTGLTSTTTTTVTTQEAGMYIIIKAASIFYLLQSGSLFR